MTDGELTRLIRRVIKQEITSIMMATVQSNESELYSTLTRFATDARNPNIRNIQPFGLSSRPPAGVESLLVPIDGNPTNMTTVGQHDANKPKLNDGETILYDQFGHVVYLSETKMQFGSKTSAENMVLGQVFKSFVQSLLTQLAAETHISGVPGFPTSVPVNASAYDALKSSPIDDDMILSDLAFTEKG